jgi:hypothetical protein
MPLIGTLYADADGLLTQVWSCLVFNKITATDRGARSARSRLSGPMHDESDSKESDFMQS